MMLKRVAIGAALFILAGTCWAGAQEPSPRRVIPKKDSALLRVPADSTGRVIVKFTDNARVRIQDSANVLSLTNSRIADANTIIQGFGMTVRPAIDHPPEKLAELEARAEALSGLAQPDLAGMMYIEGPSASLLAASRAMNNLDIVEFVQFERLPVLPGGAQPPAKPLGQTSEIIMPAGACCLPDGSCDDTIADKDTCVGLGGVWQFAANCISGFCGACCLDSGVCTATMDEAACLAAVPDPGVYSGDGSVCDVDVFCDQGACCFTDNTCQLRTLEDCETGGGTFQGIQTECATQCGACCVGEACVDYTTEERCENLLTDWPPGLEGNWTTAFQLCDATECEGEECGDAIWGSCFDSAKGNLYCDDEFCCELICEQDPYCCDDEAPIIGEWDEFCVAQAHLFCAPGIDADGANRCESPLNGSCFEPNFFGGCNNIVCCDIVAALAPTCRDSNWSSYCVEIALRECVGAVSGPVTADFTSLQGYKTLLGYEDQLGSIPPELQPFIPLEDPADPDSYFYGFGGEGWDVDGLYDLAETLLAGGLDATGEGNLTRGKGAKVAVIEWAIYENHEDLDVTVEPGETVIVEPSWLTNPDHGTACAGIIGASDNGIGVTGIVPEAELFFFPIQSQEHGYRELSAWTSALLELSWGDAISASYGPGGANDLNTVESMSILFGVANSLGISVCVSAGNACGDLSGAQNFGDSGATVVGAISPGLPFFRMYFSNYYSGGDWRPFGNGNVVHISAWGAYVTTTGYGDLADGPSGSNRSYTANFGGTSAAAPQVAALSVALQGLAKQIYGIPIPPWKIRLAMVNGGWPQGLGSFRFLGGMADPDDFCWYDTLTDAGPNLVGPDESGGFRCYPFVAGSFDSAASALLTQGFSGFDQSPFLDDIILVRGEHVFGNKYSVMASDDWYFIARGQETGYDWEPYMGGTGQSSPLTVPEILDIDYIVQGDLTDIVFVGHADVDDLRSVSLTSEVKYPGVFTLYFVEAYDWYTAKWSFVGVQFLAAAPDDGLDLVIESELSSPQRFVRSSDGRMLVRIWTMGMTGGGGFGGGSLEHYLQMVDYVDFNLIDQFGEVLP